MNFEDYLDSTEKQYLTEAEKSALDYCVSFVFNKGWSEDSKRVIDLNPLFTKKYIDVTEPTQSKAQMRRIFADCKKSKIKSLYTPSAFDVNFYGENPQTISVFQYESGQDVNRDFYLATVEAIKNYIADLSTAISCLTCICSLKQTIQVIKAQESEFVTLNREDKKVAKTRINNLYKSLEKYKEEFNTNVSTYKQQLNIDNTNIQQAIHNYTKFEKMLDELNDELFIAQSFCDVITKAPYPTQEELQERIDSDIQLS